jgi:acyl-coenzyme A thioesterase PaaI-like protein
MQVEYLKKASGSVRGEARIEPLPASAVEGYELRVPVQVHDARDELVFRASITMWISPRKSN